MLDHRGLRIDALLPAAVLRDRVAGGECWAECDAALLHQLQRGGRGIVRVLNGLDAGEHGAPDGGVAVGVHRHRASARACGLHHEIDFLLRERRTRLATGPPAIVAVDLDPVGALSDLAAHRMDDPINTIRLLGALRNIPARVEALRAVRARRDDRARHDEHARAGNYSLLDGLLEPDVGVARALGTQIANGGEAGEQRVAHVVRRARDAKGERLVEHLIVPRCLVVGMQEDVRVRIDEAGKQRGSRKIDARRVGRRVDRCGDAGCDDGVAADEHRPPLVHRGAVEDALRGEQRRALRGERERSEEHERQRTRVAHRNRGRGSSMLSSAPSHGHSLPSTATIYIPSVTNAAIRTEHLRKVYTTAPPKSGRGAPGIASDASRAAADRRGGSEIVALESLDLEVESGEFFGLLGPNGAGKKTTIGICTTRVLPTSGTAIIEGADVRTQSTLVRQRIGVVPQRPNPDSSLNVRANLVFHAAYFGIARSIANSRARALLEKLGIAERSEAKVMQLSGGQQQRLMIARALIHEPRVIFLDEPTVGIDPQARLDLWTILRDLHSQGRTIVMTTHHMEEADKLCDRLAIVDQGKLLAIDTPEALKARAPGGTMIELVLDGSGEALMRDIRAVPGVSSAEAKSEHGSNSVRVYSDRGGEVIAALVTIATAHARAIRDIHLAPPSLETLFISLTGRQLT